MMFHRTVGGASDSIVWVGNMDPFGFNGKEDRGDAHRVTENDHGEESEAIKGRDMGDAGGTQESAGTQSDRICIEQRQATAAQWVELRPLFEVYARETGYEGEG